MNSEIYVKR